MSKDFSRIDIISLNGGDGSHYLEVEPTGEDYMSLEDAYASHHGKHPSEPVYLDMSLESPEEEILRLDPFLHGKDKFHPVTNPSHYDLIPEKDIQAIDVIRAALTEDEFLGYCKGNSLKYLLRGGKKTNESDSKDAAKARQYIDLRLEE